MKKLLDVSRSLLQLVILVGLVMILQLAPRSAAAAGGASVFEIGKSTPAHTAVLLPSAKTIYSVEIASGAAGDYVTCFDSSGVTGVVDGNDGTAVNPRVINLVVTNTNTTTSTPAPAIPVGLVNGSVCESSANNRVVIKYGQ